MSHDQQPATAGAGDGHEDEPADTARLPRRRLLQALGGAAGLASVGLPQNGPIEPARAQSDASVTFDDQALSTDGTVTVASATLPEGGFVTIHDNTVTEDPLGSIVGTSAYLEPGETEAVVASVDTTPGQHFVIPYTDSNNNEVYDFVSSNGAEDTPYTTAEGDIVLDGAQISASSDGWTQQQKLFADDGDEDDIFAFAVSVSENGTTALVGAPADEDPNGEGAGSAYVFTQSGGQWTQQQKLTPIDGDTDDGFGAAVSVSSDGTTALVGALGDEDSNGEGAGSAYVFSRSGSQWSQQQKFTPTDGDADDQFGLGLSVSGDGTTAVVGARRDGNLNGENAGSAYVFTRSDGQWSQQQKLLPTDGDNNDAFGATVSVSEGGSTVLVGALGDEDPNGEGAGSAYVFTRSGGQWSQQQKLTPDDVEARDQFGRGVSVSGDGTTALIGAPRDADPNGEFAGSSYVFTRSGGQWTQQQKLTPTDGDENDFFGRGVSVSEDGTTAVIGASTDEDPNGRRAGSAYVFSRSGGQWTQQQKLSADDGDRGDRFADVVSVSGDGTTALVGALGDEDPNGEGAGSAYVFGRGDQQEPAPGDGSGPQDEPGQIVRINSAGDVYQVGRLESAPETVAPGDSIQVEIEVEAVADDATGNVVYGAVGTGEGEVYGLQQMPGGGTGSVTVDASIPAEAAGELYWTWVPAVSETEAQTEAETSLSGEQISPSSNDGKVRDPLGTLNGEGDGSQAPVALSLEAPGTVQPGATLTVTAELTNQDVPEPTSGVIELTTVPDPLSVTGENPVFLGFAGNALPAVDASVTQQFEVDVPEQAGLEQELTLEAEASLQNSEGRRTDTATQPVTIAEQQPPVERFDDNGQPGIQGDEVLDAISEFNEGGDVEATDVLDVISAFNENNG